jgi:predicted dehydrogenase
MSLDLTPEQKATGKTNFEQAAGDLARAGKMNTMVTGDGKPLPTDKEPDRRDILKAGLAVGAVAPVSAAVYFGYASWKKGNPVKTALIGCGDEGGVLVGDHNPEYNKIVAVCDIRPSNLDRIFDGDTGPRKGLKKVYGDKEAATIKRFNSVDELLAKKDELGLEAVIIATPLNTHDAITKACMDKGLHVMCEKLMARTIGRCKDMIRYAKEKGLLLAVGHQRHYSTLYAQALEMLENGILGDIKYIRALWHRNNSWPYDPKAFDNNKYDAKYGIPAYVDSWWKEVPKRDSEALPPEKLKELSFGDPEKHGFKDVAELVRWRCSEKTGGGLMAELGSHQLDASSIILGHVHPLAVMGVGGKFFYGRGTDPSHGNDRESDDGVFVTFEFPGPKHPKAHKGGTDENDVVVVTFSSFNTNEFEGYGEWVMGSKGTMFLDKEGDVYLWREKDKSKKGDTGGRDTKVTVSGGEGGKKPAMDASSTWGGGGAAGAPTKTAGGGPVWDSAVRGYRTELEHFAYCVREWQKRGGKVDYSKNEKGELVHKDIIPRCHGEVAMADAILALTANMAMANRTRIVFEDAWFDATKDAAPEQKYTKKA